MIIQKISEKTVAAKFKRMTYFHGQLLNEQDLLEEQLYIRDKLKFHNRLHGHGVIRGLDVKPSDLAGCSDCVKDEKKPLVTIIPGAALDCEGNEVLVCRPYTIDLTEYIIYLRRVGALSIITTSSLKSSSEQNAGTCEDAVVKTAFITIGITYGECFSNPSAQYITSCSTEPNQKYSRIREGFRTAVILEYDNCVQTNDVSVNNRRIEHCKQSHVEDSDVAREMIIPLARILVDSAEIAMVNPCKITDIRSFAWTAYTYDLWENAKNILLSRVNKSFHDLSIIINRKLPDVRHMLEVMKMKVHEQYLTPSMLTETDLQNIRTISPLTEEGSEITLITDENGERVLFGLPNRIYR